MTAEKSCEAKTGAEEHFNLLTQEAFALTKTWYQLLVKFVRMRSHLDYHAQGIDYQYISDIVI